MADFNNYIQDVNPFRLAGPPNWFLRQLYEFDPSLVLIPSKMGFYYRLTQRRPLKLKENVINDILKEQADTLMLASYGLVPVTTVMATANWGNPYIFVELQRRAPWRMGGASKFEQMVTDQERKEAILKAEAQDDHLTYLSKDAWRLYNKKIGTRSHMWSPATKDVAPAATSASIIIPTAPYRPQIATSWLEPRRR